MLTPFANVDEVRAAVESGEVVVAPTLLPGWPPMVQPFHWIVYDKSGKSIVIEPLGGKLVVSDNPLGVLTNSPTFDWHMTNLRNYIALNPRDVPPVKVDGETFAGVRHGCRHARPAGRLHAAVALRARRGVRATAFGVPDARSGIFSGFHILNNFDIPYGAARAESRAASMPTRRCSRPCAIRRTCASTTRATTTRRSAWST